ncbi:pap2-domain-containing protein [Lichtheimia corymbifera JMRC:FSU:9682]|uniref:Pap2-domain-containing protein n=1 Tax=Lichtheimia corymbifera JMRC:FSU:9682 TaxID=1263082 RepID=A0A068RK92_9FUNG|nr:pap2-domain-containing protein [Lichtheimia corymbifera JMRC:FSU:9682]
MSLRVDWKHPSTRKIILSYLPDWILVAVMAGAFFGIDRITPFLREFSLEDKTIMHPHSPKDSVPMWVVGVICFIVPIIIMAVLSLGFKRSIVDFHSAVLGLCLSLSMCCMLTSVTKITVGRPRPDFIDRCQPPADAHDPIFGMSNYTICTTPMDTHMMIDGFKSFPSGHSSFSFAGLAYLAFYIAGKMQMFDERGHTYKGFIFAFPIIGALLVAISRTSDYRHHWQDVFVGSLLGFGCAFFAYRQYYPALAHATCHHPYKTRISTFKDAVMHRIETTSNRFHHHQQPQPTYTSNEQADNSRLLGAETGNDSYPLHDTHSAQSSHAHTAVDMYDPPINKI